VKPGLVVRPYQQEPCWRLEWARLGKTSTVPVELIVNGYPAGRKDSAADRVTRPVSFDVRPAREADRKILAESGGD